MCLHFVLNPFHLRHRAKRADKMAVEEGVEFCPQITPINADGEGVRQNNLWQT